MVVLLAYRGGVRTFAAACGWRTSLACLLGALAAAPGSVAMLAHRRSHCVFVSVAGFQSLDDFGNLLLLSSREFGDSLKCLVETTARSDDPPRFGLAKQFLDGNTESTGHWN